MKLIDWIYRRPVNVAFGQRGGPLTVTPDLDSVGLGPAAEMPPATASSAGVMTAADKAKLDSLVNSTATLDPASFASRVQAATSAIADPQITFLRTAGYASPGDGGGALYVRAASEPSHAGKFQSADGSWWEIVTHGTVNPSAFGCDMTGASLSDAAWSDVLDYVVAARTSPSGLPGWGQAVVRLPKGRLRLSTGYSPASSLIGLTLEGAGKYATAIEFESDSATFLNLSTNLAVTIREMSLIHIPQNPDRSTWTNRLIARTGVGGGQQLHMENVHTKNWAVIDHNSGTVNNDTTRISFCRILDCRTMIFGRSSQAVINKVEHTSIGGQVERILDIGGYGYTCFDTCNIVVDGTWLFLAAQPSLFGSTANYLFRNTKGEPANTQNVPAGSSSRLIEVESGSPYVSGDVVFQNSGFSGGPSLDPGTQQISVTPSLRVLWSGGDLRSDARIETIATTVETALGHQGVVFERMRRVPLPTNVTRTAGPSGAGHPSITWKDCRGVPNLTAVDGAGSNAADARQTNHLTATAAGILVFATAALDLPFHGRRQRIVEVLLHLDSKAGGDLTVTAYPDAARTTPIGTIQLTASDNGAAPLVRRLTAAVDRYESEGLFFTVTASQPHSGYIRVTHEAG